MSGGSTARRPALGGESVDAEERGASILIVEDSRTQANWLRILLESQGYAVTHAGDGQEALELALVRDFAIVLADVDMPRLDGFELCKRMKGDPRLRSIPFVMVTQHDRVTDLIRALEVGADNFLTKPLDRAATIARVAHILKVVQEWRERAATRRHRIGVPPDEVVLSFERGQLVEMLMTSAQQLETELDTVAEIGVALTTTRQLDGVLALLANRARELSGAKLAAVALYIDDATWELREVAAGHEVARRVQVREPDAVARSAHDTLRRRESVRISAEKSEGRRLLAFIGDEESADLYLFGMCADADVAGAIVLSFAEPHPMTLNERRRYQHLANHGAVAIENARLFEHERELRAQLQSTYDEVTAAHKNAMFMLAAAVEARDGLTGSHLRRVQAYTDALGRALGLSEPVLEELAYSCVLHDVGKLLVPDVILGKPGKLTDDEWVEMRRHPEHAVQILGDREFFRMAAEIAYCHHERWDGNGYPRGLKGEEIPLPARITSVADVFDALTTRRSYKEAWPDEAAIAELERLSGGAFDPKIVDAFVKLWRSGRVDNIRENVAVAASRGS